MRNLTTLAAFIFLLALLAGLSMAGNPQTDKPTIYRIRVEEGVEIPAGASADDLKAIEELNSLLKRWPRMLWLASNNGKLVLVKMGADGLPISRKN